MLKGVKTSKKNGTVNKKYKINGETFTSLINSQASPQSASSVTFANRSSTTSLQI
jgi:hypothetical protein